MGGRGCHVADLSGRRFDIEITRTWDDQPAGSCTRLTLGVAPPHLVVEVDAPWHADPPPPPPAGSTPSLWEWEVVELMLLGDEDRYLELEFGPHGHYLVLALHGRRNVVAQGHAMDYEAGRRGDRWTGRALVPLTWIPEGPTRLNAFAIHGQGPGRAYLAWRPPGGERPDFHRLDAFGPLP